MATPSVARLGHVGIHVHDLEKEKVFFRDVVGLQVTDEDPNLGMVFMRAQPEEEARVVHERDHGDTADASPAEASERGAARGA